MEFHLIFFAQYLLFVSVCLLVFVVAAVLGILVAVEWDDLLSHEGARAIVDSFNLVTEVENFRNAMAATAVSYKIRV